MGSKPHVVVEVGCMISTARFTSLKIVLEQIAVLVLVLLGHSPSDISHITVIRVTGKSSSADLRGAGDSVKIEY